MSDALSTLNGGQDRATNVQSLLALRRSALQQGLSSQPVSASAAVQPGTFSETMAQLLGGSTEQVDDLYRKARGRRPEDMALQGDSQGAEGNAASPSAVQGTLEGLAMLSRNPAGAANWSALEGAGNSSGWQALNSRADATEWQKIEPAPAESDWSVLETLGSGLLGAAKIAASILL
ncbi:MAG: hypothetical protein K6A65_08245 [Succinivibrionaceae bacterium]|nr:hypothetical protein [Succinivibrionaceae bacterium]